jgi:hypothetical protein
MPGGAFGRGGGGGRGGSAGVSSAFDPSLPASVVAACGDASITSTGTIVRVVTGVGAVSSLEGFPKHESQPPQPETSARATGKIVRMTFMAPE